MPGGDGRGPLGLGQMSGRGAGFCSGFDIPGYMNPVPGRRNYAGGIGFGGRGPGCGWRNRFNTSGYRFGRKAGRGWGGIIRYDDSMMPEQEAENLKRESAYLKNELKEVEDRIKSLEQGATGSQEI